jgi:uncharacterized protein (TIGR03089 family)
MRTPADVLADLLRSDPARPRVTFYEDIPGATAGERIELSGKVLANWVSKAANALQEEWDIAPGSRVGLALPAHWRSLYWALAVWSVGGCVVVDAAEDPDDAADVLVTDDPALAAGAGCPAVLVTLAALARSAPGGAPAGVVDEARELATYADQFTPWVEPAAGDPALVRGGEPAAYDEVVPDRGWVTDTRVHTGDPRLAEVLLDALAAWAADGSVVLSRGPVDDAALRARLDAEGVTLER